MEFEFRYCCPLDLDAIVELESIVVSRLERPDLLRNNGREGLESCLIEPHITLGAYLGSRLVAVAILFVPTDSAEDLSVAIQHQELTLPSANFKLCMVHPQFRGNGLQCRMGRMLEEEARKKGIRMLCSTVSPFNPSSYKSLEKLGYHADCKLEKYGFERLLFVKKLV